MGRNMVGFEPIPIPATSAIPFAHSLGGHACNKIIAQAYGHWLILLLLGGFILSRRLWRKVECIGALPSA